MSKFGGSHVQLVHILNHTPLYSWNLFSEMLSSHHTHNMVNYMKWLDVLLNCGEHFTMQTLIESSHCGLYLRRGSTGTKSLNLGLQTGMRCEGWSKAGRRCELNLLGLAPTFNGGLPWVSGHLLALPGIPNHHEEHHCVGRVQSGSHALGGLQNSWMNSQYLPSFLLGTCLLGESSAFCNLRSFHVVEGLILA